MTLRTSDLAKIHIAKKDLALDDETYRDVIRNIGKAGSGSAADLDPTGRARVLEHFRRTGWKPRRSRRTAARKTAKHPQAASEGQVELIRSIWIRMADAGIVRDRTEQGLRTWIRSATRRYHDQKAGYGAPEFLPDWVAQRMIEHLKAWARRCDIKLHD